MSFFFKFSEVVKQKGLDSITVEDLVLEMVPKGRGNKIKKLFNFTSTPSFFNSFSSRYS
jgi:hypothetical protein